MPIRSYKMGSMRISKKDMLEIRRFIWDMGNDNKSTVRTFSELKSYLDFYKMRIKIYKNEEIAEHNNEKYMTDEKKYLPSEYFRRLPSGKVIFIDEH